MTLRLTRRLALVGTLFLSAARSALAQSPTTIELWSFIDPAADNVRSKALRHVLETFEAANPSIKVKTSVIQWQEISPQLLRGARAGRGPDVAMLFSPTLGVHLAAGTLQPLDERRAAMPDRDDIVVLPAARDKEGRTYAVPWEMRVTGILYRKDLLDAAGLPVPKTLPELADAAAAFARDGRVGFGIGFNPAQPTPATDWLVTTLVGMGAKVLNEDGSAAFASPQAERLLGFLHALVHDRKALPLDVALLAETEVQGVSEAGRSLLQLSSTQRLEVIRTKSKLGQAYQMMAPPTFDSARPAPAVVHGWHLAIPKTSKNVDAAWTLVRHWASPEMQAFQMKAAGYLPIRQSIAAGARDGGDPTMAWALEYAAAHPLRFDWPENPEPMNAALARAVADVLTNRAKPADALAQAERAFNDSRKR